LGLGGKGTHSYVGGGKKEKMMANLEKGKEGGRLMHSWERILPSV